MKAAQEDRGFTLIHPRLPKALGDTNLAAFGVIFEEYIGT